MLDKIKKFCKDNQLWILLSILIVGFYIAVSALGMGFLFIYNAIEICPDPSQADIFNPIHMCIAGAGIGGFACLTYVYTYIGAWFEWLHMFRNRKKD